MDAQDAADAEGVKAAGAALGKAVELQARSIAGSMPRRRTQPISPSCSCLPRVCTRRSARPGCRDRLHDLRINVAGPSNLAALLNSLQMGFRTLAIEQLVRGLAGAARGQHWSSA